MGRRQATRGPWEQPQRRRDPRQHLLNPRGPRRETLEQRRRPNREPPPRIQEPPNLRWGNRGPRTAKGHEQPPRARAQVWLDSLTSSATSGERPSALHAPTPPNKRHNPRPRDPQPESLCWEDLGSPGTPARSAGGSTAQDQLASSRLGNVPMVSGAPCPTPGPGLLDRPLLQRERGSRTRTHAFPGSLIQRPHLPPPALAPAASASASPRAQALGRAHCDLEEALINVCPQRGWEPPAGRTESVSSVIPEPSTQQVLRKEPVSELTAPGEVLPTEQQPPLLEGVSTPSSEVCKGGPRNRQVQSHTLCSERGEGQHHLPSRFMPMARHFW